jgi:hypothetical protein
MKGVEVSSMSLGENSNEDHVRKASGAKTRWLPILENELRRRMGWVDEAISPFARTLRRQPKAKPATFLPRADTLLFPSGERKSA